MEVETGQARCRQFFKYVTQDYLAMPELQQLWYDFYA